MRIVIQFLAVLAIFCFPRPTEAAAAAPSTATMPDLATLISRYDAWRGGPAFDRMRTLYLIADVDSDGLKGVTREWRDRSGLSRDELDLGVTKGTVVLAGNRGWNRIDGLVSQLGRYEVQDTKRETLLEFADVLRGSGGATLKLLPPEQIDGSRYSVIRVQFGDSDYYDLVLDPATGALHGKRIHQDSGVSFTRLSDWRFVEGVRFPFTREGYRPNGKLDYTTRVRSVDVNKAFAAGLFDKPESSPTLTFAGNAKSTGPLKFNFLNGNRIYIPATVNGVATEVLLDSGADTTVLDKAFAKQVGRAMVGSSVAVGTGGEQEAGYANDITIRIGNMTLKAPTVGVIDLSDVSKRAGIPLPVVLGKDVFLQSIVDIDPSGPTIAFHDPASFTPPAGATVVPLEPLGSLRVVPVSVEGLPEAPMIFDLGNGGYLHLTASYWQSNHLLDGRRSSTRSSGAVGGEQINKVASLRNIRFAGHTFSDVPAEFVAPNVEIDSDREAGNVGMPLLGRFRLLIDFPNNRLYAIPLPTRVDKAFPRDRSGLRLVRDGHVLNVTYVAPGSPGAEQGWKAGDVVTAVDGVPVGPQTDVGSHNGFTFRPAGTVITLTMADGSKRKLKLADYF